METSHFDVFVIGAGQAAWPLLDGLNGAGRSVGLAERKEFGGSCVNFGCTPSKAVIESARVASLARRGAEFGIEIGSVRPDFGSVMEQARAIVARSVSGLGEGFAEMRGLTVFRTHAQLAGRSSDGFLLDVGSEKVLARSVVLDTGTRTLVPSIEGLADCPYMDTENWIDRDSMPSSLAILGGGYIAVEMSQFFARMGCQVTIIERATSLLGHEDEDVSSAVQKILEGESIRVVLCSGIKSVRHEAAGVRVVTDSTEAVADEVMLAVGRRPNTDDLGLDTIGLERRADGTIAVDAHLETSVKGVYAVGDIRGGGMFTSTAWDDGRIVLGALTGDPRRTTDRVVPYAVFIDPELGRVGLTEREARDQGLRFRVCRFDVAHAGRHREARETTGFVKILVESGTDAILGATILSAQGAEISQIVAMAMAAKAPASLLRDAVYTHPTFAEAIQSAML